MTKDKKENFFTTADLSLAAALCVSGYIVEAVDRTNPKRSIFIFEDSGQLRGAIDQYWRQELRVEPQDYFNQLKVLKARIYER